MTEHAQSQQSASARPALLVFTLGPEGERRLRSLLPARDSDLEHALHAKCLTSALAAGRAAGCRLLVSSPVPLSLPTDAEPLRQSGRGFGARLRHAIALARARVRGPILVVPGDVPDLRVAHLETALAALRDDPRKVVLGPDRDGGIYLLGSSGPVDDVITGIPWRGQRTRRALRRACEANGRVVVQLGALGDLDRQSDLTAWLARARREPIAEAGWMDLVFRLLHRIRIVCRPRSRPTLAPVAIQSRTVWHRRGPPLR